MPCSIVSITFDLESTCFWDPTLTYTSGSESFSQLIFSTDTWHMLPSIGQCSMATTYPTLPQSSTISIMTGQHIATSDSVASVTNECQLYANLMDSEAASWLDTVGWEDKKKEDMESFRNVGCHFDTWHKSFYFLFPLPLNWL